MKAVITIIQSEDGHVMVTGEGDFDFHMHKDTLLARASIAAVDAVSAIVDAEGVFDEPVLTGDAEALKMSQIKNARRMPPPTPKSNITWLDGTS